MLLLTGTRKSEMLKVRHWTYRPGQSYSVYSLYKKWSRRNGISKRCRIIDYWCYPRVGSNPYLFAIKDNGKPISNPMGIWKNTGTVRLDKNEVCFHTTRHSVASLLVRVVNSACMDVKAQLAHAVFRVQKRYAKLTPERMRQTGQGVTDLLLNTAATKADVTTF